MEKQEKKIAGFSPNVVFLGIVSFLTDVGSEMIYPILPLFLNAIGVSKAFIGLVEGIAETTASILKIFSGWISDKFKKRKFLIIIGYGISAISKPLLVLATAGWHVLVLRFFDRVGKGIRTSPRDALIADSTEESQRGKAFGLHRAMDTAGAVIGPLIASLILMINAEKVRNFFKAVNPQESLFRFIFLLSIIPGILAVLFLIFYVRESFKSGGEKSASPLKGLAAVNHKFRPFLIIAAIFALANSSDAFLLLRAQATGIDIVHIPLIWLLFNVVYTILATPFGALSDKIGRRKVIIASYIFYSLVYLGFAKATSVYQIWGLFALYGVFYALNEGVQRAFVADLSPAETRATAMGMYHTVVGLMALPASIIAGVLWDKIGIPAPFFFGSALSALACVLFIVLLGTKK